MAYPWANRFSHKSHISSSFSSSLLILSPILIVNLAMKITTALLPALSGLAVAQSTVSLLLFGVDCDQHHEASLVTSDATATTYSLTCPTSVTSYDCDVFRGITAVADSEDGSYTWWGNAKNG